MHAENAVNVLLVPDTNLDVSLAAKPGMGVNMLTLCEDAANGIEGLFSGLLPRKMEKIDDGAVQFAKTDVGPPDIFRRLSAGCGDYRLESRLNRSDPSRILDRSRRRE